MTEDETPTSLIPYEEIVQDALKSVVARVLGQVAREGLPGSHHFFIAFKTGWPGVVIPKALRAQYPEEMTIVLQNRYRNLAVFDDRFEVDLSFNQRESTVVVPFAAICGFLDPAVNFALQFQVQESEAPLAELDPPTNEQIATHAEEPSAAPAGGDESGSNVVTLDKFRKKP